MALNRVFVEIQNDIFDVWHFVSAEGEQEYNDIRGDFDYLLILNRTAVSTNVKEKVYKYHTLEERDEMLYMLKDKIKANPRMYFLGEDDGTMDDEEPMNFKRNGKPRSNSDEEE